MKRQCNGYPVYDYLDAGKDYTVFEIPPGSGAVSPHRRDATSSATRRPVARMMRPQLKKRIWPSLVPAT